MSTLAETYALACGVPLDRPEIADTFFPLTHPLEKTILLHAFAGATMTMNNRLVAVAPAKIYEHFHEVVALLKPVVEPQGYKIFQIGGPNEPPVAGIESLAGKTNLHQCAYLVKRCALLIGNDSMWAHVRGAEGGAQVHIYGSTSKPHFPRWHGPHAAFIESHRGGAKPSYQFAENPKTINLIPPEQIVNAALSFLPFLPISLSRPPLSVSRQSLYIGETYHQPAIELVPDGIVAPTVQMPGPLVVRMDYLFDEDKLLSNAQHRKCLVVTNREINPNLLVQLRSNLLSVRVEVDNVSPVWITQVRKLGVPLAFFCNEKDPEKLRQKRLAYYDACLFDHYVPPTRDDFLKSAGTYLNRAIDASAINEHLRFASNKFLLSDNKVYLSKAHWKAGRNVAGTHQNTGAVIDAPEFWEEQAHFYFFTE